MGVTRGATRYFAYNNETNTLELTTTSYTYKEAKTLIRLLGKVTNEAPVSKPPASSPDYISLSDAPWIFRKLFGWQNVIKKA